MKELLKPLFSSKTRIKLLQTFFAQPQEEFFIRELTRLTGEQINSVRRELEHLEEIGLFCSKTKMGKKYFSLDTDFFFYHEFLSIFQKVNSPALEIAQKMRKMGNIDLLILTGEFIEQGSNMPIDLFIVGSVKAERVEKYITDLESDIEIRFALVSRSEFLKRFKCKDQVLQQILSQKDNIIPINKVRDLL